MSDSSQYVNKPAKVIDTPDVTLWHGDCLDVLPMLEAGSVDAIVTDPPFGVRPEEWDDMGEQEFARFSMAWLSQARRISPELVLFCNQDSPLISLCEMLYRRVRRMIWAKPVGSQYAGGRECGVWYSFELILHCHNRKTWSVVKPRDAEVGRVIRAARESAGLSRGAVDIAVRGKRTGLCYRWEEGACLPAGDDSRRLVELLGLNGEFSEAMARAGDIKAETLADAREMASKNAARAIDVFTHPTVTKGRHPCEKPAKLLAEILDAVGQEYRSVLDPFAGSGTTGLACLKSGRRCILTEKDARYIPIIKRRLADAATPLFARAES